MKNDNTNFSSTISGSYPDIAEKTFQEESFYTHRHFTPFERAYLPPSASLQAIVVDNNHNCMSCASPRPNLPLRRPRLMNNTG